MSVTNLPAGASPSRSSRRRTLVLAVLGGTSLALGAWAWWTDHRYKSAMAEIEAEIVGGRYAIACRKLDQLLSWSADPKGGVVYLLGSCELARGRPQAAGEAWARVVPGTAFSDRAIRSRARLFRDSGHFADAEQFIVDAARDPRNDQTAVLVLLVPIYADQGRVEEAERLVVDRWEYLDARGEGALEPAINLVLQHIELTLKGTLVATVRAALERAAKLAPDDDRVWLGRASLALRTGAFDEAGRWLDLCQQRRPDDPPVWRARLDWGVATNQTDVVKQAMTKIPALESNPPLLRRLNAWIAAQQGDVVAERRELELLVDGDPADTTALDRLAGLAEKDGQTARATELRGKKAAIDQWRTRYLNLHERKQPIRDAVELARLAAQLGRRFEARVFRAIAILDDPALAGQLGPQVTAGQ